MVDEIKTRGRKVPEEEMKETEDLFKKGTDLFDKIENKKVVRRVLHKLMKHY